MIIAEESVIISVVTNSTAHGIAREIDDAKDYVHIYKFIHLNE